MVKLVNKITTYYCFFQTDERECLKLFSNNESPKNLYDNNGKPSGMRVKFFGNKVFLLTLPFLTIMSALSDDKLRINTCSFATSGFWVEV